MDPGVTLSVVLPTRNGSATIGRQLDALARQSWDGQWELVVCDNGSTDSTRAVVQEFRGRIRNLRIVDSSSRAGVPHACNVGVVESHAPVIAFCNDDDEVAPGWLEAMARALADHDIVAGRLEHTKLNEPWTVVVRGRPQEDGFVRWSLGRHLPFAFGCTLGVHRALHDAIDGFDEAMHPSGEDADYCWRAQYAGAELHFVPDAVTHYRLRGNLRAILRQGHNYGIGDVLLYRKHRALGLPEVTGRGRKAARAWIATGRHLLFPSSRIHRALFVWNLGWRTGRARASLAKRVLLP
jgi:glycosyltransferase involved in cell wall biosynthesis